MSLAQSAAKQPRPRTVRGMNARLNAITNNSESMLEPSDAKKPHTVQSCNLPSSSVDTSFDDPDDSSLGIYSNRVSQVWKMTCLPPIVSIPAECVISNSYTDSNDDVCLVPSPVSSDKHAEEFVTVPVGTSSIEDLPAVVTKDPTPPPSPEKRLVPTRRTTRRVTKAVKVAMAKLQNAQKILDACAEDENGDVLIVEDSCVALPSLCKNPSITIKIRTHAGIHRYVMKQRDSFAEVIAAMAKIENVNEEDIIMFFNDTTIHPYDSPHLLRLSVADIVDCHIRVSDDCSSAERDLMRDLIDDPMAIQLVFQATGNRNVKHSLSIRKDEPMEKVMREYCKEHNVRFDSVLFKFDGERVDPAATPESLDLESEFCIDVVQK